MTEIDLDGWSGSTGNRWWVHHSLGTSGGSVEVDLIVPTRYRAHPSQIAGDANADRWQIILLGFTYVWMPDGTNGWKIVSRVGGVNRTIFEMPGTVDRAVAATANCFIQLSPAASVSPGENPASLRLVTAGGGEGSITLWGLHENAYGKRTWTGSPLDYNA